MADIAVEIGKAFRETEKRALRQHKRLCQAVAMDVRGFDAEIKVAACRSVTPRPLELEVLARSGMEYPPVYPGSVVQQCPQCGFDIYVGPKAQQAMLDEPTMLVLCFLCAARLANDEGMAPDDVAVHSLGNTFEPKKDAKKR